MLEPDNRHLLVDALKPPPGMSLDIAVGTTFTLDLQALLIAPVSFAFFAESAGQGATDPLALLEAVRRHADRITVFCQAGAISVPRSLQTVLAWLEDSVVPVTPGKPGHLFHPKVWALRFVDDDGKTSHRLIVSSRNLTFDSSWDTIVRLDGTTTDAERKENEPIRDFLLALPDNAVMALDASRLEQVQDLAASISNVRWEKPDGCSRLFFRPMGIAGYTSLGLPTGRSLILSPFLSADTLEQLAPEGHDNILVSRAEALDGVGSDRLTQFGRVAVFDSDTIPEQESDNEDASEEAASPSLERTGSALHGLHAKIILVEDGKYARLYLGSANATDPAFAGNVEFMVELRGKTDTWGIDRVLEGTGNTASLLDMMKTYTPQTEEGEETSDVDKLAYKLDSLARRIAEIPFTVTVAPAEENFSVHVTSETAIPSFDEDVQVTLRLASIKSDEVEVVSKSRLAARTANVTLSGVTSFLVVSAQAHVDGEEVKSRTLINARLVGSPQNRKEVLLSSQLASPDDLVRYLLFLLFDLGDDGQIEDLIDRLGAGSGSWISPSEVPLLETMLKTLARGGGALDRVADLLADLESTEEGQKVIPEGLRDIWEPINQVREERDQ